MEVGGIKWSGTCIMTFDILFSTPGCLVSYWSITISAFYFNENTCYFLNDCTKYTLYKSISLIRVLYVYETKFVTLPLKEK